MSADGTCPEWCDQHRTQEFAPGEIAEHHSTDLVVFRAGGFLGQTGYKLWCYVSSTEVSGTETLDMSIPPAITIRDGAPEAVPRLLEPEEARELAAALIRGAEIVESVLTAVCALCGRAVMPADADACLRCRSDQHIAQSRLRAVRDEEV